MFASVLRPESGASALSNRFAFSFCLDPLRLPGSSALGRSSAEPTPAPLPPLLLPVVRPARTGEALSQLAIAQASRGVPDWDM